ncbi:MAG: T9SS type A sorting domain-containing protein [Bacteroidales bacterium]
MKKIILFVFICLLNGYTFGQEVSSYVIAAAGENSETSELSVSWTLGEIAVETLESSTIIMTQGFQQGYYEITSVDDPLIKDLDLKVYPNPATEYIYVELKSDEIKSALIELYNIEGKLVLNEQWDYIEGPYKIDLNGYGSSQYILRISDTSGQLLQTYKIIKQ